MEPSNGRDQPLVTTPTKKVTMQPKGGDEVNIFSSLEIIAHKKTNRIIYQIVSAFSLYCLVLGGGSSL